MHCSDACSLEIVHHHCWWLGMLPQALGQTAHGHTNRRIHVAYFDEDLQDLPPDEE